MFSREGETLRQAPPDYALIAGWRPNREQLGTWSPDGQHLVTWRTDRDGVRLLNADGSPGATILGGPLEDRYVNPIAAWAPGSTDLLVATESFAGLYDPQGRRIAPVPDSPYPTASGRWGPRGELFASLGKDGSFGLWDRSGARVAWVEPPAEAPERIQGRVRWTPDGERVQVFVSGAGVRWFDRTAALVGTDPFQVLAWHPDGRRLMRTRDSDELAIVDPDGAVLGTLRGDARLGYVVVGEAAGLISTRHRDGTMILWTWEGERYAVLGGSDDVIMSVCFDPLGELMLTGTGMGKVRLWPLTDAGLLAEADRIVPGR